MRRRRDGLKRLAPSLAALLLGGVAGAAAADATRGRALFEGSAALPARVHGQDFALPAQASRCVNCHVAPSAPTSAASAVAAGAPLLTAAALSTPTRRRGGPPSRYDAASLCTLLRSGVDPAYVMIQRTMPRYDISDADCQALWLHLMERR
jgi:hypothetical protein